MKRLFTVALALCWLANATAARAQAEAPGGAPRTVSAREFGAAGDGQTDDSAALQRALDSLRAGDTLRLAAGETYGHGEVLTMRHAGTRLSGPGTLLATREQSAALSIDADDVTVDGGLKFRIAQTSRRFDAPAQNALNLLEHKNIVVRDVFVDGAGAAGIFVYGASNYLIEDVTVENTRADGIHQTHGAHDGMVRRARVRDVGIAIVSYGADGAVCRNITVESPRFTGNNWGRGFSVVGGQDITFRDVYAENSNAAAIYIACEGAPYYTAPVRRVRVEGGEIKRSNGSATVDHGAVLIYNARAGSVIEDVTISDLKISDTNARASRQVGILVGQSGGVKNIQLVNFSIDNGPGNLFVSDAPAANYTTRNWTFNGTPQTDREVTD